MLDITAKPHFIASVRKFFLNCTAWEDFRKADPIPIRKNRQVFSTMEM